jgi:hypothetical protein
VLRAGGFIWGGPKEAAKAALIGVRVDGALQVLAHPMFMEAGLYPNSMVKVADGTLYVGLRHFVARLIPDASGYREEVLLPAGRPPFDFNPDIDTPRERGPSYPDCPAKDRLKPPS